MTDCVCQQASKKLADVVVWEEDDGEVIDYVRLSCPLHGPQPDGRPWAWRRAGQEPYVEPPLEVSYAP